MNKIALFAVSPLALALAACGGSDDASEDALADNVEMPADEAMADMPMPVADETEAADEAGQSPQETLDAAEAAAAAADAAVADVEAAGGDAEVPAN